MTNDGRDWPRNRETRVNLFSGRSRSVGSFRSAHMESGSNRLREPRLSIGAGIRDLERRTAEVPAILRNNIHNVIEELRPIVERARTNTDNIMYVNNNGNVSLASWLSNPHPQAALTAPHRETTNPTNPTTSSDEVVIDVEAGIPPTTSAQSTTPTANIPSPTQSAETANTNSINSNNGSGDEQDIAETQVLNVSNSVVLNTVCKYLPFLLLILTKFVFDNIPGILEFIALSLTFYYYNIMVKREVARQTPRSIPLLLLYIAHILVAIIVISYLIYKDLVPNVCLGMSPPSKQDGTWTLSALLWSIILIDYVLKLITVIIKAVFSLLPQKLIPTSKRGKWYLFIEATSQLYRASVPIQPWLMFLLDSYKGPQKVIGVFLSAAYMVSKGNLLMGAFKLWWMSLLKVLRNVTIGGTPTKEQIASAGNLCSICHDEFKTPVILECQHIFCEVCVTKWLDREQTCPLCRAKIADDPSWRDGSTTYFIQLF